MADPRPTGSRRIAARLATAGLALFFCTLALPAGADLPTVIADLERLRTEVAALRGIELAQAADPARLADFEVRLQQLEEELRGLTGRIEQLEYGQRTLEQRFDQLVGDLDQRLRSLEQGAPGGEAGGATAPLARARPPQPAPAAPRTSTPAPAPAQQQQEQQHEQTLGQVPQSAVLGLPRPEPSAIPPPQTREVTPQKQYDAAVDLLRAGDYAGADRGLQLFLDLNPGHPLAANAAYWQAESQYVRKNYAAAAASFARNYRTYGRNAAKAPDNLLKLGMSLDALGEKDKACLSYAELEKEFPDAPAQIQQALARERSHAGCA
jgi:tol-pal system protein YbgF